MKDFFYTKKFVDCQLQTQQRAKLGIIEDREKNLILRDTLVKLNTNFFLNKKMINSC